MEGDFVDDLGLALEARAENDAGRPVIPDQLMERLDQPLRIDRRAAGRPEASVVRSAIATVSVSQKKSATSGR